MAVLTGFCDSNGTPIRVGDLLRKIVDTNRELHGNWAYYRVVQRGIAPFLFYEYSEAGEVLPPGMAGGPLTDEYDIEQIFRDPDPSSVRPNDELLVSQGVATFT